MAKSPFDKYLSDIGIEDQEPTVKKQTKDLITKVTLSDGQVLNVYMPTIGDFEELFMGTAATESMPYTMASKAVGMSIEEFRQLSAVDGMAIINVLLPAMEAMTGYLQGMMAGINLKKGDKK